MARVYDRQWYVLGEEVRAFEQQYAHFNRVRHVVGVSNGLDALVLALRAVGVGAGDEVIVPSNTYIATWLAVSRVGAQPVAVEPDPITSNLDPALLEAAITGKTKAIIPVHLYGQACQMAQIMAVAQKYQLHIVEDNAQAQGAAFEGRLTGSFGIANATSFYPSKNLGALGDAGAVTTDDSAVADRLRMLRNYGSVRKYHHETIGYNARLDELQAAVLCIKLAYLAIWTQQRQQIAAWYRHYLSAVPQLRLPQTASGATHVYHLYVIHTPHRDALHQHLARLGIETMMHYPIPPHRQAAYAGLLPRATAYPIADELANSCLSLPLWPGMTQNQVATVAEGILQFSSLLRPKSDN